MRMSVMAAAALRAGLIVLCAWTCLSTQPARATITLSGTFLGRPLTNVDRKPINPWSTVTVQDAGGQRQAWVPITEARVVLRIAGRTRLLPCRSGNHSVAGLVKCRIDSTAAIGARLEWGVALLHSAVDGDRTEIMQEESAAIGGQFERFRVVEGSRPDIVTPVVMLASCVVIDTASGRTCNVGGVRPSLESELAGSKIYVSMLEIVRNLRANQHDRLVWNPEGGPPSPFWRQKYPLRSGVPWSLFLRLVDPQALNGFAAVTTTASNIYI